MNSHSSRYNSLSDYGRALSKALDNVDENIVTQLQDEIKARIDNDGEICESECLNFLDCNWDCSGSATIDECGVCDNDSSNDCIQDCTGIWGGNAYLDNCDICVDGNTGIESCIQDCQPRNFLT